MATVTNQITSISRATGSTVQIIPVSAEFAATEGPTVDRLTVTQAASLAVPLGVITTPRIGYFSNVDATNFIKILDDTVEIARLSPSTDGASTALIPLPDGIVLKAQADTADCLMDYALYEAAP